jgi:predicted transcriptional regulator
LVINTLNEFIAVVIIVMSFIPDISMIKKIRKKAGLSQSELAQMVHVSQSHLAKIETDKVDPSYSLVSRIFDALDSKRKDECWLYMTKGLMRTLKGEKVEDVYNQMKLKGFSQMPVYDSERYIGLMTERRILQLRKAYQSLLVEDAIEDVPLVPKTTSYDSVVMLIQQFPAVLVEDGAGKIIGIITGADLVGHERKPQKA